MTPSRSALVRGMARALAWSQLLGPLARTVGILRPPAFPILTFHRVNDDDDPFFPAVPTAVFERHMAHVARTYRVLPVDVLVTRAQQGQLPRNALAITFDDGYRDNLTHAAPILARYDLPATIFLATGCIGTAEVPWFDRLALAFKTTRASGFSAPWGETLRLADADTRLQALERTLRHLKRLPDAQSRRALESILEALAVDETRSFKNLMLTWDDVHALMGLGFSVGAHTVNHPILSRVSPERAWTEILGSRSMIESACGAAPAAFAYPNGGAADYTDAVTQLVGKAGFTCAVTTRFGLNTAATPPLELHRGGPWEHETPLFALKLAAYRFRGAR